MRLIDFLSDEERQQLRMRYDDASFPDYVNELLNKEVDTAKHERWIPCSEVTGEGYPKKDGFYYVTERNYGFYLDADSKQNVTHTSHFFNGDFTGRFYDENHSNIVAWMPLPEPYKIDEVGK